MEKKKFPHSILSRTKTGLCILAIMMAVVSMAGQAIGAENSILYLHSKRGAEWSGTLDYNPPTRGTGEPANAELPEAGPRAYLFSIQAEFDTSTPAGLYIFNLWIKADNDQRIIISLGCRSQTMSTNFGGWQYDVKKSTEITEYSFDYSLQESWKIYEGEWFYAQISLGPGLALYIDHQSTPSSIITPSPVAIPEFPYRAQLLLLIGVITCISLTKRK